MDKKSSMIEKATRILIDNRFNFGDYIFSLQGPTLILTKDGKKKMTLPIQEKLKALGLEIL